MLNGENIYLLSMYLLLGMLIVMSIFNSFIWYSSKDKIIGFYILYMLCAVAMIFNKFLAIANGQFYESFSKDSWSDNLISTILGITYTFFCYEAFNVKNGKRGLKYSWYQLLILNCLHVAVVIWAGFTGNEDYLKTTFGGILLFIIFAASIFLIINALLINNKTQFQKLVISGVVFFISMLLFAALQENYYNSSLINGRTGFFMAIAGEMIFFALASAQRIKDIYKEKNRLKIIDYQYQLEIEKIIGFFATSISTQNTVDDMLWNVTKNLISKLGFEDCVIYLADTEHKLLIQKSAWGPKTSDEKKLVHPIKIPFGKGIVGAVAVNNKAEIVNDTSKDKRYIIDDAKRFSEVTVPISSDGKVLGIIDSENSQKNFYTQGHLQILTTIASLLANRIVIIQAAQSAKEKEIEVLELRASNFQYQLEIEQVINYFATTISSQITVDEMLWDIAKNLIGKLDFEDCMIYLWNEEKTMLLQKAGYGLKGDMKIEKNKNVYHIPKNKGIVGAAVQYKQSLMVNDTSKDSRYFSADEKIMFSELSVPILNNNEAIGVINTEHSKKNFFTQRHLQILTTIAALCADKIDKINAEQQTREKEMEVLKLNKDLATSQLTALRAQMNPHFIFNALNSVQQYILTGDVDQANKYLSKFSRLQRAVLNHCDQNFIVLEREIEMLQLYLQLEQLRMKENFEYGINISDAIDTSEIKIPPMILQPFVENAIWHGLIPKEGNRQVGINFSLASYNNLQCVITDNGIGRSAAEKIKQQNSKNNIHKSKGLGLVYERLQVLQLQYQQSFTVEVTDVLSSNGQVEGTQVLLNIYIGS